MKKWVIIWLSVIVSACIFSAPALAEFMYVGDITELNVRADRSVNSDIVGTLASAEKVEVITFTGGWTKIRLNDGTLGWVVSRYLNTEKPPSLLIAELNEKLEILEDKIEALNEENSRLVSENKKLSASLDANMEKLTVIQSAYGSLKDDSKEYLTLKKKFDTMSLDVKEKNERIKLLEQKVSDTYLSNAIKWFLVGASVLLVGFILGARTKRKRSSLL